MLRRNYLILAAAVLVIAAVQAFAAGTLDYNLIVPGHEGTFHVWAPNSGGIMGDDVHRTTSDPLVGVDLMLFNKYSVPADVDLLIYSNADDTAAGAVLLATYENIATIEPGHWRFVHYDLPAPLTAPADLWIGTKSDSGGARPERYTWSADWSLGVSHSLYFYDLDERGFYVEATPGYPEWYNFGIATYSAPIPEPGGLLALSTGLIGLLALRRRR